MVDPASLERVRAAWPAPERVQALTTTRQREGPGASSSVWGRFNLALHVDDEPRSVEHNRELLAQALQLPSEPVWLQQVHGRRVLYLGGDTPATTPEADASWSDRAGVVCAVMTADCLPVFFCDRAGSRVAVAHAGWRGLGDGVISACFEALQVDPDDCLVWLGPAIGPGAFEVGVEVYETFTRLSERNESAFKPQDNEHWLCDVYALARNELESLGVGAVYGGGLCTYTDSTRFYSYRRDGITGRMASLVWLKG